MRNIFLFFVDRIRSPETDVLIPTSFSDSGTHPHLFTNAQPIFFFPIRFQPYERSHCLGFFLFLFFFLFSHKTHLQACQNERFVPISFFPSSQALYGCHQKRNPATLRFSLSQSSSFEALPSKQSFQSPRFVFSQLQRVSTFSIGALFFLFFGLPFQGSKMGLFWGFCIDWRFVA